MENLFHLRTRAAKEEDRNVTENLIQTRMVSKLSKTRRKGRPVHSVMTRSVAVESLSSQEATKTAETTECCEMQFAMLTRDWSVSKLCLSANSDRLNVTKFHLLISVYVSCFIRLR